MIDGQCAPIDRPYGVWAHGIVIEGGRSGPAVRGKEERSMSDPVGDGGQQPAAPQPATPQPATQPGQQAMAAMSGMWNGLRRSDQLMAAGALLALVGGDWLFGAILGGGGLLPWVLVTSAELPLAIWIRNRRPNVTWVVSYGLVVSGLVVSVAVTEFSDFLFAIFRGGLNGQDMVSLLADLCAWGGAVLMTWGAIEYWRSGGS
jgi:hypothetical protein